MILTMYVIANPNTTKQIIEEKALMRKVLRLLKRDIKYMEITAIDKLTIPAPTVAYSLFSSDKPAF